MGHEQEYYLQERLCGSISRNVPLPSEVIYDGTVETYRNGVIEIRLKKNEISAVREITIS